MVLALSAGAVALAQAAPRVRLGIDVLAAGGFETVKGQRIGLITHPAGVAGDLRPTIDVLKGAPGVQLVALFGPEHGARGDAPAGDKVEDYTDPATGLPVRSIYGKTRKPTPEMLADIDTLVFDLQDIGSRSYTFISTLAVAMEAAAENGKRFVVLDRPNPITGVRIEGRPLELKFQSFVGQLPIPYLHGMTVGELAQMINGEGWMKGGVKCDLTVIPMQGWTRDMWWDQTGLVWVPTSPHIPRADSSAFYACTGILGELGAMSIGVGYTLPFELIGKPGLDADKLAAELNSRKLAGVYFRATYFQPFYAAHAKKTCGGVQVVLTDRNAADLTAIQFHAMDALHKLDPEIKFFGAKRDDMFDKVCGTDTIRKLIDEHAPIDEVLEVWRTGVEEFRRQREKYLLYR
jgi:uncharacterized protein YbbC (DUF1343 family)